MRVAFGYTIRDLNDDFVHTAEETVKITDKTMANGSWLVDYYPIGDYQVSTTFSKTDLTLIFLFQFVTFLHSYLAAGSSDRENYGESG